MSARASPRAWVRRVHGVNACSRHCQSARDVKSGSHEKDELEPASARADVRARAALQGRQGQQGACLAQGAVQKIATRTFKEAPRAGPTRGSARRLAGAWKSSGERRPELFLAPLGQGGPASFVRPGPSWLPPVVSHEDHSVTALSAHRTPSAFIQTSPATRARPWPFSDSVLLGSDRNNWRKFAKQRAVAQGGRKYRGPHWDEGRDVTVCLKHDRGQHRRCTETKHCPPLMRSPKGTVKREQGARPSLNACQVVCDRDLPRSLRTRGMCRTCARAAGQG